MADEQAVAVGDEVYVHCGRRGEDPAARVVKIGPKWVHVQQGGHRPVEYSRETGRRKDGLPGSFETKAAFEARLAHRQATRDLSTQGLEVFKEVELTTPQIQALAQAAARIRAGQPQTLWVVVSDCAFNGSIVHGVFAEQPTSEQLGMYGYLAANGMDGYQNTRAQPVRLDIPTVIDNRQDWVFVSPSAAPEKEAPE